MNKRIFTMMMMIALLMAAFVPKAWGQQTEDPWDGTTTTEVTPVGDAYKISTGAELAWVASQPSSLFEGKTIQNDIDLGDKEWTPIPGFEGTFDGQGHTIKGLSINIDLQESTNQSPPDVFAGLFTDISGTVTQLGMNVSATTEIVGNLATSLDNQKEWKDITTTRTASQLRAIQPSSPTSENYTTSSVGEYHCKVTSTNTLALNGDIALPLPAGNYVVVVNNRSYKVQINQ